VGVARLIVALKPVSRLQPSQRIEFACEPNTGRSFIDPLPASPVREHDQPVAAGEIKNEQIGSAKGEGRDEPADDVVGLGIAASEADTEHAKAEGVDEAASERLRALEARNAPLMVVETGAERDVQNAEAQLAALESNPAVVTLVDALRESRQLEAAALIGLQDAERAATAHDVTVIGGEIGVLDKRFEVTRTQRNDLEKVIAGLEARIEAEGGKGLADRAAAAHEEAEAAAANLARVTQEADTLKLLRDTLEGARAEASRTFVGPVARRARRHIERLLPGCDLSFGDDLGLNSISRRGLSEGCGDLSQGRSGAIGGPHPLGVCRHASGTGRSGIAHPRRSTRLFGRRPARPHDRDPDGGCDADAGDPAYLSRSGVPSSWSSDHAADRAVATVESGRSASG